MTNKISLGSLKREIARERKRVRTVAQRDALEKELKELRDGQSNKFLKRLGRGFKVLAKEGAKATGKGIKKLSKFAEERNAGEGVSVSFQPETEKPLRRSPVRRVARRRVLRRAPVRRVARRRVLRRAPVRRVARRRVLRRAPVRRVARRRVLRRAPVRRVARRRTVKREESNGGFFGGLSDNNFFG